MSLILEICFWLYIAMSAAGMSIVIASFSVAWREDQIRRAWKQSKERCIYWLETPHSDLPTTSRKKPRRLQRRGNRKTNPQRSIHPYDY